MTDTTDLSQQRMKECHVTSDKTTFPLFYTQFLKPKYNTLAIFLVLQLLHFLELLLALIILLNFFCSGLFSASNISHNTTIATPASFFLLCGETCKNGIGLLPAQFCFSRPTHGGAWLSTFSHRRPLSRIAIHQLYHSDLT